MSFNRFKRRIPSSEFRRKAGEDDFNRSAGDFRFKSNIPVNPSRSAGDAENRNYQFRLNLIRRSDSRIRASRKKLASSESHLNGKSKRSRGPDSYSRIPESVFRERKLSEVRRRIAEGYYESPEFMEELASLLVWKLGFSTEKR